MTNAEIKIREVSTIEGLAECVRLQKEVFGLPDLEISPVRHLIVTQSAGGFTLGAFVENELIGFVLSVPMFAAGEERAFYSHMTAVSQNFQSCGVGAKLKWAQREKALETGIKFIKWTFQPVQARNAFFNLEKLGVVIREYQPNFYGTEYSTLHEQEKKFGLDSDRLFAEWRLESEKVAALSKGEKFTETGEVFRRIETTKDWNALIKTNPREAVAEQTRIKKEFQTAFSEGLICKGFERSEASPKYLLFANKI